MPTLIYSPEVRIRIRTAPESRGKGKIIDVSEDITRGSITRVINGVSSANFQILNQSRKYDGMFSPMDTVVIYLRRIKTVLKFSGYLDTVPKWTAVSGSINLSASCSLKRLQNFYWDPNSAEAVQLTNKPTANERQMQDGGLANRAIRLLTEVAEWPQAQIHIARIPENWYDKIGTIADELIAESEAAQISEIVGSGSWVNGTNASLAGLATVEGIGPGTGRLPATRGRISHFGGPGGGAYGNMALTGESGVNPRDPWYVAMRWPYTNDNAVSGAKQWWVNRKILVVNPANQKSVVLRAADWGPHGDTGRVIDVSPRALSALGASTDDTVHIAFAPVNANLGPVSASDAAAGEAVRGAGSGGSAAGSASSSPGAIRSGWGSRGDESNMVSANAGGCSFQCHRLAKTKFEGFVNDLVSVYGYRPAIIGGYNDRNIAGTSKASNHAYGAAIDIDPARNPYYSSAAGGAYALPKGQGLVALARKWGLGWGGEWNNSKDYMHFEVLGAPASGSYDDVAPAAGGRVAKWKPPIHGPYTLGPRFGEQGPYWANGHSGTDFQTSSGTNIYAVGPGNVHDKGYDDSYGNFISIDHGGKVYTFYAHMEAPSTLSVGKAVDESTVLGFVGSTGNTTGPHLHIELRKGADTYAAALRSGGIEKYILGGKNRSDPPVGTIPATGADEVPDLSAEDIGKGLFNAFLFDLAKPSREGLLLGGHRALMNDTPILSSVAEFMTAGQRHYCSAPNGDFIAWFPDYFGHYRQAGKMVISPLEINGVNGPPSVGWSDQNLKTHVFVSSASGVGTGDAGEPWRMATTAGVASVEFPELMMALLNVSRREAEEMRDTYLNRYGARPVFEPMNVVTGARQEFFFACHLFMQNWSQQYQASIELMFMPELYPGMLLCVPEYGMQGYIRETTDTFDLNSGFSTTVSCAPWSAMGPDGAKDLPMGAPL